MQNSDLTDKMKRSFLQAVVVSILHYGCTTWTLTKRMEKKLDGNYTRMLQAILNKFWRHHPTKQQLYGRLPPNPKTIQVRRTRHAEHDRKSRDELISYIFLWTPSHRWEKAGQPARTYLQQLSAVTWCSVEDLPETMDDRGGGRRESGRSVLMVWHDDDDCYIIYGSRFRNNVCLVRESIWRILCSTINNFTKCYAVFLFIK